MNFFFVLSLLLGLGSIKLPSLFSLFYVTGEFHRLLHRGRAAFRDRTKSEVLHPRNSLNKHNKYDEIGLQTVLYSLKDENRDWTFENPATESHILLRFHILT